MSLRRDLAHALRRLTAVARSVTAPVGDSGTASLRPETAMTIQLDYVVRPRPRYGHGHPSHPQLEAVIARGRKRYEEHVASIVSLKDALAAIPAVSVNGPQWQNGWLPGLDAAALYTFLVENRPRHYIEIGSGVSTTFARRAVTDHNLPTTIISIDPAPRVEIDALCDQVIRASLEECDLDVFNAIAPGDIVFLDGSHRAFTNSDATVALLEVLPSLPGDVLLEVHDVYLPEDYPPEWNDRWYSEQYLLAAYLLGGDETFVTEFPAWYVSTDQQLASKLEPLWSHPTFANVERHGGSYWLRTVGGSRLSPYG
jgi:hypothetical protein